ncbi:GEVED domain-containing protein [Tenacibaculum sp.]|nr:GEVED domain-containing protein [Tenacibaculum sp.]
MFFSVSITAQEQSCSFEEKQQKYYDDHPEAKQEMAAFEKKAAQRRALKKKGTYNKMAKKYTIPVVFHIYGNKWPLTGGENSDVTEAKVNQAMTAINADFAGFNDPVNASFSNIEGGMDIEFKLAQIDPDGNTTNGIVWHETKEGFGLNGTNDSEIAKYAWDNFKYMNVHIQLVINAGSTTSSGIAWFPAKNMSEEGTARVVYNGRYMIYNPPASSLTHEFGHWLGLHHTFNGGCVSGDDKGDKVADTPPCTSGQASEAGGESCKTGVKNCFSQLINYQNHMDYNPCESMFTKGQVTRMTEFLNHDARKTLWTDANLVATGVKQDLGKRILFSYQDRNDSEIDKSQGFLEDFKNDGGIQNKKRLKAIGGATFATTGNLQQGTHFTATGVPSGLTPVINVTDNTNAIVSFTGKANSHEENNSKDVKITLLNAAITGGVGALHSTSGTFKINFLNSYKVHYETYSPYMSMGFSGSNVVSDVNSEFNSLVIGGSFRTRLKVYDGNILAIDNFAQGFEVLCNTSTINAKYFAEGSNLNASSSGTWVKKATLSIDSPPVLSSPSYTSWRNKTGYVAIRVPTPTNEYVYGWLRARVSSNGEEADIMNLALNPDPNKGLLARIERPHLLYSTDRFLEKIKNDNTIENEITVDLKNGSFIKTGSLERGKHYDITNVPKGLIMKVNAVSSTQVKLKLEGVFAAPNASGRTDWAAVRNINFKFLNGGFSSGNGANIELKKFTFSIEKVGQSYTGTNISHPTYNLGQTYSSPPGQFMLLSPQYQVVNAGATYQFQNYPKSNSGNKFPGLKLITWRRDAVANNNYELTPLSKGTVIGANSSWKNGREFQNGRGQHMIDSDTYKAWRGRTAYYGVRVRRSGRMHYGWAKMRVSSNGTQFVIEEYGVNGTPNASIRAGELLSDDVKNYCTAGTAFGPDRITRVTFANIDRSTSTRPSDGYDNQTDHTVKLVRGKSYNLKVAISGNSTNEIYAFFDWNQDKDFNDTGERVEVDIPNGTTTGELSINVPTNAALGGSGMRLRISRSNNANSCGSQGTGEVEDYSIFVSNTEIATCDDGIQNGDETKVDCGGSCKPCEVFTEICAAQTGKDATSMHITNVAFGSINNASAYSAYNNFTSQTTNLEKGQATTLTVTTNRNWSPNHIRVWIDWYNDNDFLSKEESVLAIIGKGGTANLGVYTASVTPPANAVVSTNLRMRVRAGYTVELDPCGTDTGIGEVEDYTVTVGGSGSTDTQAPTVPSNLTTSNITSSGLVLNWTASTDNVGVTGYDVYRANTILGTAIGTTYNVTGLTANTSYTFSVRAKDAAGNQSATSATVNATTTGTTNPSPTYCESKSTRTSGEFISKVVIGTINNTSTRGTNGYQDHTSKSTNLVKNSSSTIAITPDWAGTSTYDEGYAVWIDYNQDGDFADSGEKVFTKVKSKDNPATGSFTVPNTATLGNTRMRIIMEYNVVPDNSCDTSVNYGEVEDYTVNITGGGTVDTQAPTAPSNLSASGVAQTSLTLNWGAATDNVGVTGYDVYRSNTKLITVTGTTYNVTGLTASTGYTFSVKAKDAAGNESVASNVINVTTTGTTTPTPTYCSAGRQGTNYIAQVTFGSISNTSQNGSYSDNTSQSTSVTKGQSVALTVTPGIITSNWSSNVVGAWIDWNQDGDFTDAGEEVLMKTPGTGGQTTTVSVPNNAKDGATRLRVRYRWGSNPNPCGTASSDGDEVEDYGVVVGGTAPTDTQAPTIPSSLSASGIGQTALTLSWTASTDNTAVTGYDVYRANTKLNTVTGTSYNVTGLTASTAYTFSVKAKDAAGNESASSNTVNATTTGATTPAPTYCAMKGANNNDDYITNVNFGGINNTSAKATAGYHDYTSLSSGNVSRGASQNLKVTLVGWQGGGNNEVYAWFDWNRDGDFTDAGEKFSITTKTTNTIRELAISIPSNATIGTTRMRIVLGYNAADGNSSCGSAAYGEVEDYNVNISGSSAKYINDLVGLSSNIDVLKSYPNPFRNKITIDVSSIGKKEFTVSVYNILGKELIYKEFKENPGNLIFGKELKVSGSYFIKIRTSEKEETLTIVKQE